MTKIEHLLIDRYEVVADYPGSCFEQGDIIQLKEVYPYSGHSYIFNDNTVVAFLWFDKYPHLFRKLHWAEKREISELTEYVKVINGSVRKVISYDFKENTIIIDKGARLTLTSFLSNKFPATLEDYLTFQNSLK